MSPLFAQIKLSWAPPGGSTIFVLRGEDKGTVALIDASPDGYVERGRFEQTDRSRNKAWPHPVIAGGKLYLRDEDVLLCYRLKAN